MRSPIVFTRQLITIETLRSLREGILLDPHYQRQGDVWPTGKQQLLIDSILNGFLVPPMYWHAIDVASEYFNGTNRYAVVDGRQRLEALFSFLSGDLGLSPDNTLLGDPDRNLAGMKVSDLRESVPWLYAEFMRTGLEVVIIETDDVDLIEELFSRLNEGVPLKAAEKRNRGQLLAPRVKQLALAHSFFESRLPFGNRRYRHYDLLAKFMRLEDRSLENGRVPNLKKLDLDRLFDRLRGLEAEYGEAEAIRQIDTLLSTVEARLDRLTELFHPQDPYLGSVGMVTIYYAFDRFLEERGLDPLTRDEIESFEAKRLAIKHKDESDYTDEERQMSEFATYSQGPTSATHLSARLRILARVLRDFDPRAQAELEPPA